MILMQNTLIFNIATYPLIFNCTFKATRSGGMISNLGNFVCGWGMAVTVIAFTVSFEYNSYGSVYQ